MTLRECLNNLDETGIGTHKKFSASEIKKMDEETVAAIRANKELMKKRKKRKPS
jgi:hypothetical protein